MRYQYIIKICADSLRSFSVRNYDIKLKAAHAHELVAIFLGYKSKNAMLTDTIRPLDNLQQAEFIIFDPSPQNTGFTDKRLKEFGYEYLNTYELKNCFYSTLRNEEIIRSKVHVSFREIAIQVAEQCLHQRLRTLGMNTKSVEWNIDGGLYCWENNGDALLKSEVEYDTNTGKRLRYTDYTIHLPRTAANLGYSMPRVEETFYSGDAAKYSDKVLLKKYPIALAPMSYRSQKLLY